MPAAPLRCLAALLSIPESVDTVIVANPVSVSA
jgi:hypothetical protein